MPRRSERMLPFESWDEVERVAEEAARWGPLILFMVDVGARPGEAIGFEHRHVRASHVELPGTKTSGAWRTVHMTGRGRGAVESMPRSIVTRCVLHVDGRPISWPYFTREVWHPALKLAGLEKRPPYSMRHTFAYWSLRAGVPIATLAREMGHASTASRRSPSTAPPRTAAHRSSLVSRRHDRQPRRHLPHPGQVQALRRLAALDGDRGFPATPTVWRIGQAGYSGLGVTTILA
jgi:integrase